ncbi:pectinesterase inhibitor 28-like [Phoenix dactylifera]|uniref:Pectinesterase inhibitor 28 n=1 Tax=Phoenix dactylifera TaxID=42345 RepID=A0A8B7BW36_PHODC|nr:pectinesterase inhibitor 28 [Phoenix dactylifera]XP_038989873.1 pectinesterase inhibitor 28-like [Phoenix dactylifera]
MAPISSFIFFLFFPLLTLSLPSPSNSPLIQKTCNVTTSYNLCVATLQSDPRSLKADDEKALLTIIIGIAISDAANTSSYVSSLTKKNAGATLNSILRACGGTYRNAGEALRSAADALADENYDYAYVHVSAAREYPSTCSRLFRMYPRLKYPTKIAHREEGLEQFCTIALDIVSLLG